MVGIACAAGDAYPDPKDKGGKAYVVDVAPVKKLPRPVRLSEIKPSLSVMPVSDRQWGEILKMAEGCSALRAGTAKRLREDRSFTLLAAPPSSLPSATLSEDLTGAR